MNACTSRREFLKTGLSALGTVGAATACTLSVAHAATRKTKATVKKGVCRGIKGDKEGSKRLRSLNAKWYHNWTANLPDDRAERIEFVPMVWKAGEDLAKTCQHLKERGCKQVIGFNEPDQKDQSNMTVEQAIAAWPTLMKSGLRLGSPGCAHPDHEWMKKFIAEARKRHYRVDFVTAHWYWHPQPDTFFKRLEGVYKLFGLPIWITEFAVADWEATPDKPNRFSPEEIVRFLEAVLPVLESTKWIERYCWFSAPPDDHHLGSSALFDAEGTLTKVGKCYASL